MEKIMGIIFAIVLISMGIKFLLVAHANHKEKDAETETALSVFLAFIFGLFGILGLVSVLTQIGG